MNLKISLFAMLILALSHAVNADCGDWISLFPTNDPSVRQPIRFHEVVRFLPHQIAVGDLVCTGTVVSTNDGYSANFAVDDIIWGGVSSTNISISQIFRSGTVDFFTEGEKYLVVAYTNNWWIGSEFKDISLSMVYNLYDFITPTSRPPNNATFENYRVIEPFSSVISFDDIVVNGTNYWDATRTFITNFIDMAKIQHDERKVYEWFYDLTSNPTSILKKLPSKVKAELRKYKLMRYDKFNLPPPDRLPPRAK